MTKLLGCLLALFLIEGCFSRPKLNQSRGVGKRPSSNNRRARDKSKGGNAKAKAAAAKKAKAAAKAKKDKAEYDALVEKPNCQDHETCPAWYVLQDLKLTDQTYSFHHWTAEPPPRMSRPAKSKSTALVGVCKNVRMTRLLETTNCHYSVLSSPGKSFALIFKIANKHLPSSPAGGSSGNESDDESYSDEDLFEADSAEK